MSIIKIDNSNIDSEHICCAIGNDKANKERAQTKKDWMKNCFQDGLVFKRLDERGKVFIEYMPIEKAWKPVEGKNLMLINCLWVSGRFKKSGHAANLLSECIKDSRAKKMDGIAVVSSSKVKPFLTDKRFYEKNGFVSVDSAAPYFELLFLKFNNKAVPPTFTKNAKQGSSSVKKGLAFIYSNQCPFIEEYIHLLADISKQQGIKYKIIKINNSAEAKKYSSPFGTLGIYYNGQFQTHELMPEKKFLKFIGGLE